MLNENELHENARYKYDIKINKYIVNIHGKIFTMDVDFELHKFSKESVEQGVMIAKMEDLKKISSFKPETTTQTLT